MKKFYDTCSLLEGYGQLDNSIVISSISLEELEDIKTSRNKDEVTKYKARKAVRAIEANDIEVVLVDDVIEDLRKEYDIDRSICNNDAWIIRTCQYYIKQNPDDVVIFYSEDYLCRLIAERVYLIPNVSSLGDIERENIYFGYKKIEGTSEEINAFIEENYPDFVVNEYLVMHNTDEGKWSELRFDGKEFVGLKLPPSSAIKGKNSLQRCVLDALYCKDIGAVAILGLPGSGKTHLAMQTGLYMMKQKGMYDKIIGVREPVGEGHDIGYLPGSEEEKTGNYFMALCDQLDGGEYELENLTRQGKLVTTIPYFCKGRTFNNSLIIVDEAEDLTSHLIKMLGTRAGVDTKIVFVGDYKQGVFDRSSTNPLLEMCSYYKGNKNFACVMLDEDVRGEISKMFAEMDWGR